MPLGGIERFIGSVARHERVEPTIPHRQLLEYAWAELSQLDPDSEAFLAARARWSSQLLSFWRQKLSDYQEAGGVIGSGQAVDIGDERITTSVAEAYEDEDTKVLDVLRKNPIEEDEVVITASGEGIDDVMRPPQIKSKVSPEPGEVYTVSYEVTFSAKGEIRRFERVEYFARVRRSGVIDCSSLAVRERWEVE